MRILLVEDEPRYARFLREVLLAEETRDHELTSVESLDEAVAQLRSGSFDIVLLDLGLPDADGIEALTAVSAVAPAMPVVVLSSLSALDIALESMRHGAQEYLVKGQSEHLLLPRAIRNAMERKRLQDAALVARNEAVRANKAKDAFLAMLGHELRNPLAPIVTALELIRRRDCSGINRELTIIERQVDSLGRLVDDLLDVARIARGKLDLNRIAIDLAEVVETGVEVAMPLITERRHRLTVNVPRGRTIVIADRARMAQVIANLLTNAAKYTEPGGRIDVSAGLDGGLAVLHVRDTGIGMSEELLARVFEWFEQGEQSLARTSGGLGLGLAIVKNILTLHGGSVSATSQGPGKGSEFVVRLPVVVAQAEAPAASLPSANPPEAPRCRVLIVDDNSDAAEMLRIGLEMRGHQVFAKHDAPSALAVLAEAAPDLALLDIGLPGMDGYELARCIRTTLRERAPVLVALTGYGGAIERERARAAGFAHHLVKPVGLEVLTEMIVNLSRQRADEST